jgi:NAD(P)-dependent dehydrogenase (short-subunit alcohol dehydrogenase family)
MQRKYRSLLWLGLGASALMAFRTVKRRSKKYSFQNKAIVITGGARGLGLVLARMLAAEGAKLAICSRNQDQLDRAAAELRVVGAEVLAQVCDVTDKQQIEAFLDQVTAIYGKIDVLINNAGIIQAGPIEAMRLQDFKAAMDIHFWAPLYTMMHVVPAMKERGEGRVVNIASIGGRVSVPHIVPYSASKFALVGLSKGFAEELRKDGIYVTTINPGLMRTGSVYNIGVKGQQEKEYAWFTTMGANLLTSSSVEDSARQIIDACRYGEAEVITNLPARILALANDVFPELTADIMGLATQYILPDPTSSPAQKTGLESDSDLIPEHLRKRSEKAADKNNEF